MKALLVALCLLIASPSLCYDNIFFAHHSTGRNLIDEGDVRENLYAAVECEFWDHDYHSFGSFTGLRNPEGVYTGTSYGSQFNYTDVDDWEAFWTGSSSAKISTLANHEIIAFKSCYPNAAIGSQSEYDQYVAYYEEIFSELYSQINHKFVVMGFPPLRDTRTNATEGAYARQFSEHLETECAGLSNVYYFDLFGYFAGSDNYLKDEYERTYPTTDSHPNAYANSVVGPIFAGFLAQIVDESTGIQPVDVGQTWGAIKAIYK